jgi:hypothetical protein
MCMRMVWMGGGEGLGNRDGLCEGACGTGQRFHSELLLLLGHFLTSLAPHRSSTVTMGIHLHCTERKG